MNRKQQHPLQRVMQSSRSSFRRHLAFKAFAKYLAATIPLAAAATIAVASTCTTDCWTDSQGNQHCNTICN